MIYKLYKETICQHSYLDTYEIEANSEEEAAQILLNNSDKAILINYDKEGTSNDEIDKVNILNLDCDIILEK